MERFAQALAYLLPQGFAWPREPGSVLMRLLRGLAASLGEFDAWTAQATREWLPHRTHTRLEEWEEATGLPDPCFGAVQGIEPRRARVLARLRGPSGYYRDSSPAALGVIEIICLNLGYRAQARYNTPFRCGRDRAGHRLGVLDGKLYVLVTAASAPFRVRVNHVGERLVVRPPTLIELACALEKYVPARFELNLIFL